MWLAAAIDASVCPFFTVTVVVDEPRDGVRIGGFRATVSAGGGGAGFTVGAGAVPPGLAGAEPLLLPPPSNPPPWAPLSPPALIAARSSGDPYTNPVAGSITPTLPAGSVCDVAVLLAAFLPGPYFV